MVHGLLRPAVNLGAQRRERLERGLLQKVAIFRSFRMVSHGYFGRSPQGSNQRHRQGPRSQPTLLATTECQGSQGRTLVSSATCDQRPDALGSINLVPAHRN